MIAIALFVLIVYLYSLFSQRLKDSIPIVFALAGVMRALVSPGISRDSSGGIWEVMVVVYSLIYLVVMTPLALYKGKWTKKS